MDGHTTRQADEPKNPRRLAFARRRGRSTESVLQRDSVILKRSLDGIKDWTARLPSLLDKPVWRPPHPYAEEFSPGWRRHDRTHLEINLEHPVGETALTWEAWIFLPHSFRLNSDTYSSNRIGADFQSHVRFSAPHLRLQDVPGEVDKVAAMTDTADSDDAIDELKLFACRVRDAIAREAQQIRTISSNRAMDARALTLADEIDAAMMSVRENLLPAAEQAGPEIGEMAGRVDEHLSNESEGAMVKLVRELSRRKSKKAVVERIKQVAVAEARHRDEHATGPSMSADSSTFELEQLERHRHALKRLTSSVLWLQSEAEDPRRGAENGLHAIAAGIAMAFAVTAALLYGTPNDATDLWVWGGLAVLAYMGKDRIKTGLQGWFNRYIERRYPNRRWKVRHEADTLPLATADEKYRFVDADELPPDIAAFRRDLQSDAFGETLESDSILHHRQATVLDADLVHGVDERFNAITEILRIDIARWLTHTDDPSRTVTLADPESGELIKSSLPRAYDVTILHRLAQSGVNTTWNAARVVLSRKGIRRVDQLEA